MQLSRQSETAQDPFGLLWNFGLSKIEKFWHNEQACFETLQET